MSRRYASYTADYILSRVTVAEILQAFGAPKLVKGRCNCPVHHGDNKQAFSVDEKKGTWICFVCGKGGGKVDLVAALGGLGRAAAMEWIADMSGLPPDGPVLESERREMEARRKAVELARQIQTLRERSLDALRGYSGLLSGELLKIERYIQEAQSRKRLVPIGIAQDRWFTINSRRELVERMRQRIERADAKELLAAHRHRTPGPPTHEQVFAQREYDHLLQDYKDLELAQIRSDLRQATAQRKALQELGLI
jgi:DNA primase